MPRPPLARLAASLLSLAAAAGCGGPKAAQGGAPGTDSPAQSAGAVPLDSAATLFHAYHTGFGEPTTLVVRDGAAWAAAWARLHRGGEPPVAPPAVDFAREMVLVVALGERPTGGHDVAIDAVTGDGAGGATVAYTAREPGEGCMSTQALTSPAVAVRVARVAGPVRFERRVARPGCQ